MAVYNTGFRWNATATNYIDIADLLVPREKFSLGNYVTWASSTNSGTGATENGTTLSGNWMTARSGAFAPLVLATKPDGTLWGWGMNYNGEFGNSVPYGTWYSVPTQLAADNTFKDAFAGEQFSLFLKQNGTLWWTGRDIYGSSAGLVPPVGATTYFRSSPLQILHPTNKSWKTVATTYHHVLAIDAEGALWSWGYNLTGELGINTRFNASTPTQVGVDKTWAKIAVASFASLGIKTDGTLWTWGDYNYTAQNVAAYSSSPTQVSGGGTWIDAGFFSGGGAGVKSDGTLWTWGSNYSGNQGSNDIVVRYYPYQIGTETTWKKIWKGGYYAGAIKTDGTMWTWGLAGRGLGDGTTAYSSPVQINIGGTNWKEGVGGIYTGRSALKDSSLPGTTNNSGYLTNTSGGTFTVPAGVTSVTVVACAGGGGGGGGSSRQFGQFSGGGGGGSGEIRSASISVTPGQTITYEVGAAGSAGGARDGPYSGGSSGTAGGTSRASINGGATWFVVANGGGGGTVSQPSNYTQRGLGGSGGTGTVVAASQAGDFGSFTSVGKSSHVEGGYGARGFVNYTGALGANGLGGIGFAYCDPCRDAVSGTGYGAGGSGGGCMFASDASYYNGTWGRQGFVYIYW